MKFHWLRYGGRRTGFEVRAARTISFGFRWSSRVFNAPRGPWVAIPVRRILLDASTLRRQA